MSRNGYKGAEWRFIRELTKQTNAVLREQRQVLTDIN